MVYFVERSISGSHAVNHWWNLANILSQPQSFQSCQSEHLISAGTTDQGNTNCGKFSQSETSSTPVLSLLIGRNPEKCNIVLEYIGISRCHARLECDTSRNQFVLTDLGTPNGTRINNSAVKGSTHIDPNMPHSITFADAPYNYAVEYEKPSDGTLFLPLMNLPPPTQHINAQTEQKSPPVSLPAPEAPSLETSANDPAEIKSSLGSKRRKHRFESKWDVRPTELLSTDTTAEQISERLRNEVTERAKAFREISQKNLKEKRKLLWGSKRDDVNDGSNTEESKLSADLKGPRVVDQSEDPNRYAECFVSNLDRKSKFLKLMGYKGSVEGKEEAVRRVESNGITGVASEDINRDKELELQYYQGLKRMDGRKTGLGM